MLYIYRLPIDTLFFLVWLGMIWRGCDVGTFFSTSNVIVVGAFAIVDSVLAIAANVQYGCLSISNFNYKSMYEESIVDPDKVVCAANDSLFYYMIMLSKYLIYIVYFYYAVKSRMRVDNEDATTRTFLATDLDGIRVASKETTQSKNSRKKSITERYERTYFKKTSATIRNIRDVDAAKKIGQEEPEEE